MQAIQPTVRQKVCKKCNMNKPASEFCRSKWGPDGLHSRCKVLLTRIKPAPLTLLCVLTYINLATCNVCVAKHPYRLEAALQGCIKDALPVVEQPTVQAKTCSRCHAEKPSTEFDRYKRTTDGLQSQCKACMKVRDIARFGPGRTCEAADVYSAVLLSV